MLWPATPRVSDTGASKSTVKFFGSELSTVMPVPPETLKMVEIGAVIVVSVVLLPF